jgi:hypothetical protein
LINIGARASGHATASRALINGPRTHPLTATGRRSRASGRAPASREVSQNQLYGSVWSR